MAQPQGFMCKKKRAVSLLVGSVFTIYILVCDAEQGRAVVLLLRPLLQTMNAFSQGSATPLQKHTLVGKTEISQLWSSMQVCSLSV